MKKIFGFVLITVIGFLIIACDNTSITSTATSTSTETSVTTTSITTKTSLTETPYVYNPITVPSYVLEEERLSFKFFWEVVNGDEDSPGYGLISDRYNNEEYSFASASIASVGYGLASIPAGIENDWISYSEGYLRVLGTIETLENMQRTHGFYYHFVNMDTATRAGTSEVSIIDTAIMICGAIVAGEYFGGIIKEKVNALYQAIEWDWYFDDVRNMFYMGYQPESGFSGHWDMYSEQLMLYFLAIASEDYSVSKEAYYYMKTRSTRNSFGTSDLFYVSYPGTIFTYQFSHAFFDFRNMVDRDSTNWFTNSVNASIAAYDYAIYQSTNYKTLSAVSWGMTASDGPDGYKAYGNLPAVGTIYLDGTLAPSRAIGSIVFVPELVIPAMENYASIPKLQCKYGFRDAYHLGFQIGASTSILKPNRAIPVDGWFSSDVIGIDKGITVLMIENYRSSLIWDYFMKSEIVQKGITELEFQEVA